MNNSRRKVLKLKDRYIGCVGYIYMRKAIRDKPL